MYKKDKTEARDLKYGWQIYITIKGYFPLIHHKKRGRISEKALYSLNKLTLSFIKYTILKT